MQGSTCYYSSLQIVFVYLTHAALLGGFEQDAGSKYNKVSKLKDSGI